MNAADAANLAIHVLMVLGLLLLADELYQWRRRRRLARRRAHLLATGYRVHRPHVRILPPTDPPQR